MNFGVFVKLLSKKEAKKNRKKNEKLSGTQL